MTNDKATARPWELKDDGILKDVHIYHTKRYLVARNEENRSGFDYIADFRDGNMSDRDYVIKAVNNHEALIEAVKSMYLYISTYGGDVTDNFMAGGNGQYYKDLVNQASK